MSCSEEALHTSSMSKSSRPGIFDCTLVEAKAPWLKAVLGSWPELSFSKSVEAEKRQ